MNFTIERKLEDLIFTSTIKFASNGTTTMTAEEELALMDDFGAPLIDAGGQFSGNFKLDAGVVVEADLADVAGVDCDTITFVQNSLKVEAKEGFEISYSSNSKRIEEDEYSANVQITTAELLAESRCKLFEETILARIDTALDAIIAKLSTFETSSPINRTLPE